MIDAIDIKAHPMASSLNKEGAPRLIGGTKGGMTSNLHVVCDSKGGPLRLHLSEGQCSDFTGADVVLKDLPPAATVTGNQGYDRDKICKMLSQQGITPCISPRRCRKKPVHCSNEIVLQASQNQESLFSTEELAGPLQPATAAAPTSSVLPSSLAATFLF